MRGRSKRNDAIYRCRFAYTLATIALLLALLGGLISIKVFNDSRFCVNPTIPPAPVPIYPNSSNYCSNDTTCVAQCKTINESFQVWYSTSTSNGFMWFNSETWDDPPIGNYAFINQTILWGNLVIPVPDTVINILPSGTTSTVTFFNGTAYVNSSTTCGRTFLSAFSYYHDYIMSLPITPVKNDSWQWCGIFATHNVSLDGLNINWTFAGADYRNSTLGRPWFGSGDYSGLGVRPSTSSSCNANQSSNLAGAPTSFVLSDFIDDESGGSNYIATVFPFNDVSDPVGKIRSLQPMVSQLCHCDPPPTEAPTSAPSDSPTEAPSNSPTRSPTNAPSDAPTPSPTNEPTEAPTPSPTNAPTNVPTRAPTLAPTSAPTKTPTEAPSNAPTNAPTTAPINPTVAPTNAPTSTPTKAPTEAPSLTPTKEPTDVPTKAPTEEPTLTPTKAPTNQPTGPTKAPTNAPTHEPTWHPTVAPSDAPTTSPTGAPSLTPSREPTTAPTRTPTEAPSKAPTRSPTEAPSKAPTRAPTEAPTMAPTNNPTLTPTRAPTEAPTNAPTRTPTKAPTKAPTESPTRSPTRAPTRSPTSTPTNEPGLRCSERNNDMYIQCFLLLIGISTLFGIITLFHYVTQEYLKSLSPY